MGRVRAMAETMTEPTEAVVCAEAHAWLEANWSPQLGLVEWRTRLVDSGWGVPSWPAAWHGTDLPATFDAVVADEMRRLGAVSVARSGVRNLAAATLLAHGDDYHKRKFLRRILTGEDNWCQLFQRARQRLRPRSAR